MHKTLTLLQKNPLIKNYEIQDFKSGTNFYYIKAKATISNETVLFIKEFVSSSQYAYSYHWQDENGVLIVRWDNAPHHKDIRTFPHHKHLPDLEESTAVNLEDVLREISNLI